MLSRLQQFYKGKKIFLTGHTGFKGSWMALWLKKLGADVYCYALTPEGKDNLFTQTSLDKKVNSILGDINDIEKLKKAVSSSNADIVFHLAAQALVRRSYKNPVETYMTNVIGTANLFEAVRDTVSVKTIVNITTDKCYENKEWVWPYRESDELGGYDPYSSSKACAEIVTSAYRRSFFKDTVGIATARAGNVIGGGDFSEDRIIPDIVRSIALGEPVYLRNPEAIRPWQHVLDAIHGYLVLGMNLHNERQKFEGAYNFSPSGSEFMNVLEVTKIFIKNIEKGSFEVNKNLADVHEASILKLDPSKAKNLLQWQTQFTTEGAIDFSSLWYKNYLEGGDIVSYTDKQLDEYQNIIK